MGDVILFPRRESRSDIGKVVDSMCKSMDREAARRLVRYREITPSAELLRVFALYPMFRLTHANKGRQCLYCDHRIAPLELHFVHAGSYVCQSGTCMPGGG